MRRQDRLLSLAWLPRLRWPLAVTIALLVTPSAVAHGAPPVGGECDTRLTLAVDAAKHVLVARPRKIAVSTRDNGVYVVRVTYTVERTLEGAKVNEVVVEETCKNERIPVALVGYPASSQYCASDHHALPGLAPDGRIAGGSVPLLLRSIHADAEGVQVASAVHENEWGPCPNVDAMFKRRPALRDLVKRVTDLRVGSSRGFPTPEPPATAVSASASAPPRPPPPPSASAAPTPSTSATAAPTKYFGCALGSPGGGSAVPAVVALAVAALVARRRRGT